MTKDIRLDLTNKFLIALPAMEDPRFERAVVFICHHDADGAMGLIINKPKGELTLSLMLPQIGIDGDVTVADTHVLSGGPVDIDRGFVLHTQDCPQSDDTPAESRSLQLKNGICLSSTRDALEALVSDNAPKNALLAIGYSGWGGGQLEQEIQANAWMIAEGDPDIIFDSGHDQKWERAIRSLGIEPRQLSAIGGTA